VSASPGKPGEDLIMKTSPRLEFDESCLRVVQPGAASAVLRWDEVREIFAFKDDVFACDIICMGFRLDDEGAYLKIDEECGGYKELLVFLPTVFPVIRTGWFAEVAFPAFATCLLSLWGEKRIELIWNDQP
jgi:hypothetical protein